MVVLNRRQLLILWVGLGLFVSAFIWDALFSGENNLMRYKNTIENYLHKTEKRANDILNDKNFIDRRLKEKMAGGAFKEDLQKLDSLQQEPFNFCIFKDDSLVFWSQNDVLPTWENFSDTLKNKICIKLLTMKSSQYELRYRNLINEQGIKVTTAALIPLKKMYPTFEGEF